MTTRATLPQPKPKKHKAVIVSWPSGEPLRSDQIVPGALIEIIPATGVIVGVKLPTPKDDLP